MSQRIKEVLNEDPGSEAHPAAPDHDSEAVCDALKLKGGDRLEIIITADHRLLLKPKKLIDADDPAYRLGQEILDADGQIQRGEVVPWDAVKRQHGL